jgi:hypothetical protein
LCGSNGRSQQNKCFNDREWRHPGNSSGGRHQRSACPNWAKELHNNWIRFSEAGQACPSTSNVLISGFPLVTLGPFETPDTILHRYKGAVARNGDCRGCPEWQSRATYHEKKNESTDEAPGEQHSPPVERPSLPCFLSDSSCSISSLRLKMEAVGIEPASDFDVTGQSPSGCVFCAECRAANALHCESSNCLSLALTDANLQRVIAAWNQLSKAAKAAILALLDV